MGSNGVDPRNSIDPSAGGLVWVRRRNGAWWPGRILGMDELPEGCVPTPSSGTPVQLLGREDASVDWYNLEKSKRVKAFRCGEYDAVIEKAKASTSSDLYKKAVKYARREDAILHALEIETARLGVDFPDSTTPKSQQDEIPHVELPSSSQESEDIGENLSNCDDDSDSIEGPDHLDAIKEESKRWKTPNDSEDDGNEGVVKRMKGLEDLGVGVESSLKRKRSQVAHEFLKKKSRRRTLTNVLECSTKMVSDTVVCESNKSKKNKSIVVNNNSNSTCENEIMSEPKENETMESPDNEYTEKLFDVPLVAEKDKESGPAGSCTDDVHNMNQMVEKGTSEWQLKGKRNSRSRKADIDDEAETYLDPARVLGGPHISDGPDHNHVKSRPIVEIPVEQFRGRSWNAPQKSSVDVAAPQKSSADVAAPQRLLPFRQSRFTVNPKYDSSDFPLRHHIVPSGLYDVAVEVKMSYRAQRVPYISLVSKLNNRPIIGHPIAIEVLDDGSCECYSSSSELDYNHNPNDGVSYPGVDLVNEQKPHGKSPSERRAKSPKGRNGLLSKKTRKLSALTGSRRQNRDVRKPVVEKLKGPSVACVPLKIVFSRINAALNSGPQASFG